MMQNEVKDQERGVIHTNRPPANSQTPHKGSEDTAVLSLYVSWNENVFEDIRSLFDKKKEAAQSKDFENSYIIRNDKQYLFHPAGHRSGTGSGPMYRWKIECEGVKICIANQHQPKYEIPNMIVQAGSLFLMKNYGLMNAWPIIQQIVEALECEIVLTKPSRIDGCVDLVDIGVLEYVTRYENNCYISRAQKGGVFNQGKRKTGFKLGTGKQIRVYDKLLEVLNQPEKLLFLIHNRWGGRIPQFATRIEFQVGTAGLRDLGIITLKQYEEKRQSLFHYLCHDWFRMTDVEPGNNHHNRISTSPLWETVQQAFDSWTESDQLFQLHSKKSTKPEYKQLAKQALGCINSIIALRGIEFDGIEALKSNLVFEFKKIIERENLEDVLKQTEQKRIRFKAAGRGI